MNLRKKEINPIFFFLILLLLISLIVISKFSKGTKGSLLNETIIFLKQPYLVNEVDVNNKEIVSSFFQAIKKGNYINYNSPVLKINVSFRELTKLKKNRKKALTLHPTEQFLYEKTWIKGTIEFKNKVYKARIRLKGDRADHWGRNNRWSLKFKLNDDSHIFGFNTFSVTNHKARAYPQNQVISNSLNRMGIIVPEYKTIQLRFNGDDWGLMYIEENFGNSFFEKRLIKENPILRFTNQSDAEIIARSKTDEISTEDLHKIYFSTGLRKIKIYKDKKFLKQRNSRNIISFIQTLNEENYNYPINKKNFKFYDHEKFIKVIAMNMLLNDWHSTEKENMRYYFNIYTHRLEPIPTDFHGSHLYNNFSEIKNLETIQAKLSNLPRFYNYIFSNNLFYQKFSKSLKEIILDIPAMEKEISLLCEKFVKSCPQGLNFENIRKNYNFINNNLYKIFSLEKNTISHETREKISINLFNEINSRLGFSLIGIISEQLFVRFFDDHKLNILSLVPIDIDIIGLSINYNDEFKECNNKEIFFKKIKKFSSNNIDVAKFVNEETCLKNIDNLVLSTQIDKNLGKIIAHKEESFYKKNNLLEINYTHDLSNLIFKDGTYIIESGEHFINEPLIIPKGLNLKIEKDTIINFSEESYIYLDGGNLTCSGENNSILLTTQDKSWRGIYVKDSKNTIITGTVIEKIDFFKHIETNISLTGGLNFYNSNIIIDDFIIKDSFAEDAINIIHSSFTLKNIKISNGKSDGIDSDFSHGTIENIFFNNIAGDGLDTSGSQIKVKNFFANNIGDKSISIGEKSNFEGENLDISNSYIGIAVKDDSIGKFKKIKINKSTFSDLMAYNKKPFFNFGGVIFINDTDEKFNNIKKDSLSKILINDENFNENNFLYNKLN